VTDLLSTATVDSSLRIEHGTLTPGTAALIGQPDYWRAVENGWEGVAGYGDTPEQAISDLERITAWRRA
jgi:hypothetical protein